MLRPICQKFTVICPLTALRVPVFSNRQASGRSAAFRSTLKLAHILHTDQSDLQHNLAQQRRALEGLEFKPISNQPAQLAYHEHL